MKKLISLMKNGLTWAKFKGMKILMKIKESNYIVVILLLVFASGCSSIFIPRYENVIYNDRQPLISVTYDYGEIELRLPLFYPRYRPKQIAFQVYSAGDTTFPLISVMEDPLDEIVLFLPHGVLELKDSTNLIKVMPQDYDFRSFYIPFKGINAGQISLPRKAIDFKPLIVRGIVTLARNDSIISGVDLSVQVFPATLATTKSDKNGMFEMGIPGEFMKSTNIELVAGSNLIFKTFRQKLDYSNTKGIYQYVRIGPSKTLEEPIYLTNKKRVHFRDNPDIGSKTKFLLEEGESVSVKRTTRGEYFGDIEVLLQDGKLVVFDGWIAREDLTLMQLENIFSKENNNENMD
tara:strand:- start:531 stop:1574 length:1044 start_codon:yes stop_codon:yes gene_type:complete